MRSRKNFLVYAACGEVVMLASAWAPQLPIKLVLMGFASICFFQAGVIWRARRGPRPSDPESVSPLQVWYNLTFTVVYTFIFLAVDNWIGVILNSLIFALSLFLVGMFWQQRQILLKHAEHESA